jgi:hypothetical protein
MKPKWKSRILLGFILLMLIWFSAFYMFAGIYSILAPTGMVWGPFPEINNLIGVAGIIFSCYIAYWAGYNLAEATREKSK